MTNNNSQIKERVYETPEDLKGDGTPCSLIRKELKFCLNNTECVEKLRITPKECVKMRHPSVPDQCYNLLKLFFECKRSILDNRTRFRGRKGYVTEYD